jgi:hypothetical protein
MFMIPILFSCDPASQLEANIENLTSENLSLVFVSADASLSQTLQLQIAPGQTVLFQKDIAFGSTYTEPNLVQYDSVVIQNQADEILKVYQPGDSGKNIYNIEEYWNSSEPSKRFFKYEYEIEREDIE